MPQTKINLSQSYEQLVEQGLIVNDMAQQNLLGKLQSIIDDLVEPPKRSFFGKLKPAKIPASLYIYGNVGRGKSMLMDLFYISVPDTIKKRRVHFHAFMQEVHSRIHVLRQNGMGDPVALLASELAHENELLCFDELQATDVTDATLLQRLFEGLFAGKLCIVSTSNRPPSALYSGGLQAERFEKFIELIEEKMTVAALSSPEDYRYQHGSRQLQYYFYPLGEAADKFISQTLKSISGNSPAKTETLTIQGRQILFKAYNKKIGFFTFHELCETMMGAADYLALARRLNTIILTEIPKLSPEQRNEAKRFSTLIDTLYEYKTKLICTAAVHPEDIYKSGDGSFEFQRTISRLVEMQSSGYDKKLEAI